MTSPKSRKPDQSLSPSSTTSRSPLPSPSSNTPHFPPQFSQSPSSMTLDNLFFPPPSRSVDEVWRDIVSGRRQMKSEQPDRPDHPDEMMTLEDFLAKAGAADEVKMETGFEFDSVVSNGSGPLEGSLVGFGSNGVGCGRGKRGRAASLVEPLDKAAQQRQRRMIKNRESAARSRERKQAYQIELETLATKLEEENERLLKEKEERTKERFKQLMEKVIPVVEKRRPPRLLRRVRSFEW